MSLKIGVVAVNELYQESLRRRFIGISEAAILLMKIFDQLESAIVAGLLPSQLKKLAQEIALSHDIVLESHQVALCRFGEIHPSPTEYCNLPLLAGEAFTLDIWLKHQGYHADLARIYMIAPYRPELLNLRDAVQKIQEAAILAARSGDRLLAITQAAQQAAAKAGVYIVEGACGHGVGYRLHEEPEVAFCYNAGAPFSRLKSGHVITIEPLITLEPATLSIQENGVVSLKKSIPFLYAEAMIYVGEHQSVVIGR